MSESANPTRVGIFVVGAAVLALAAVVAFGSMKLFQTTKQYEIHFDQSLMGLSIGAPVIFQGVQVGTVVDVYAMLIKESPPEILTPVVIELVEGRVRRPEHLPGRRDTHAAVSQLVETGLRAQLDVQSLVTGQLYVSMVIEPKTPIVYRGDGNLPEIPSIASDLEVVKETLLSVVQELRRMPLEEIGDNLVTVLSALGELARSPETRQSLEQLSATMGDLRALVGSVNDKLDGAYDEYLKVTADAREVLDGADDTLKDIDRLVEPGNAMEQEALAALAELRSTLQEVRDTTDELGSLAESTLADVDQLIEPGSPMMYEVQATLEEVRRATRRLGAMADLLLTQPDAVLFGRGQRKESP